MGDHSEMDVVGNELVGGRWRKHKYHGLYNFDLKQVEAYQIT